MAPVRDDDNEMAGYFPRQLLEKHQLYSMPTTAPSVQNDAGTA